MLGIKRWISLMHNPASKHSMWLNQSCDHLLLFLTYSPFFFILFFPLFFFLMQSYNFLKSTKSSYNFLKSTMSSYNFLKSTMSSYNFLMSTKSSYNFLKSTMSSYNFLKSTTPLNYQLLFFFLQLLHLKPTTPSTTNHLVNNYTI